MKKVLIIRPKVGFGLGGAETHSATIAIKLIKYGYKVGIIANKLVLPEKYLSDIEFYPIKFIGRGSLLKYLLFLKQAQRLINRINYDFLISPFRFPQADLLILCDPLIKFWLSQKYSNTFIKSLMKCRLRYAIFLKLEKEALYTAKRIICLFNSTKELIRSLYPENYAKAFVCYRGIDFKRFNPELKNKKKRLREKLGFNLNDYLILFVGKDPKRKGLPILLKVFKELPRHTKLIVAGIKGKSDRKIIYLGAVRNIENFYAISDLVVLPTFYDPGAMVTMEALASGTPVITSVYDGTSEFIKEGVNGYVTNLKNEDLKNKILMAMKNNFDPQVCYDSIKHLTWDNYVKCLISHISQI